MSDTIFVAFIAGAVAIVFAFINAVVSESYKRFRDGTTVAASLAGELASYEEAWPQLRQFVGSIAEAAERGTPNLDGLRSIERPKDFVYEKAIDKLGLLGAQTAESVVYVYSNINAFRLAFELISREHASMSNEELRRRAIGCKAALDRAATRGEVVLGALRARASAKFEIEWPWTPWKALFP